MADGAVLTQRVALLGMAHPHAADHLVVVRADPTTELVAVYDRDPSNVAAHGELPTSRSPSWAMSNADVAVVASTTAEHVELVSMATGAGLAVFVEKPLATNAAAAAVLAALVDAAGVPFATGMFLRCLPALIRVRTLLADGSLGQLSAAHARFTHPGLYDETFTGPAAWMHDLDQGATGGFADLGIHVVDALRWLRPGAPLTVLGARLQRLPGHDLDVGGAALLDWAGTPTTVHAGWTGRPGGLHLHVEGNVGSVTVQDGTLTLRTEDVTITEPGDPPRAGAALAAFLADLRGERQWVPPTTSDAVAVAEILDTIARAPIG